jgi:hypothetical protein
MKLPRPNRMTNDSCTNGNTKTVFLGIAIAIGVKFLKTDPDTDSDTDPECLNRRISNFEVLVRRALCFCGSLFAPTCHW